ncbi:MAG: hypothetical protein ACI4SR_00810 [Faecalibacillus sp.]
MDKKHQSNLLITILCAMIVGTSLWFLYDNFHFQTYGTITYYDYLLSTNNQKCLLENYKLYKDQSNYHCGDGTLTLTDIEDMQPGGHYTISLLLKSEGKTYPVNYQIVYGNGYTYSLDDDHSQKNLKTIDSVQLKILDDKQSVVYVQKVKRKKVQSIYCFNKEFRIENACISSDFMRLGYLTTSNKEMIKKYPQIIMEYRYLKDENGDEDDDNNYIVFKKIKGLSKDYVNQKNYETYNHDLKRGSLLDKKLSVVIIFLNEKENYTFKMDFTLEAGE